MSAEKWRRSQMGGQHLRVQRGPSLIQVLPPQDDPISSAEHRRVDDQRRLGAPPGIPGRGSDEQQRHTPSLQPVNRLQGRLSQQLDTKHELSHAEHHLASLYVKTGDLAKANMHFDRAVSQKQELGDPSVITASLDHVDALMKSDDLVPAQKRLNEVNDLLNQYAAEDERARLMVPGLMR